MLRASGIREVNEAAYSLGLLLAEMQRYVDAERYLGQAAAGMPGYSRVHYNHGQVLLVLNRPGPAGDALRKALSLEPQNQEFFIALAQAYLKTGHPEKARVLATETLRRVPDHVAARDLLRHLDQ